ncbi:MAG: SUKH-3 domain-containing protein [Oscillospiraceae bacterium]
MNTDVEMILKACGYDSIKNSRKGVCILADRICREYNISDFDYTNIVDTIIQYNGISVDASIAMRKNMVISDFRGGFRFSLQYVLDNYEYLYDDYKEIVKHIGTDILPIGDAFADILLISSEGRVYVGDMVAAEKWEDFLIKLISDQFRYI